MTTHMTPQECRTEVLRMAVKLANMSLDGPDIDESDKPVVLDSLDWQEITETLASGAELSAQDRSEMLAFADKLEALYYKN